MSELAERPSAKAALPTPLTPLIGRKPELAAARDLLLDESTRLLTVTGPGGVGKTRFALALAEAAADEFADGVAFVELAPVREPALVLPTIVQAVGLSEEGELAAVERLRLWLANQELLLALDNLEHLLEAAPCLAELLLTSPGLTLLVTSRARLRLSGERAFELPLLPREDAIALFQDRARTVGVTFELDREALDLLCARLDDLPLAVELAAARLKLLSAAELLARLEHPLELLGGGPRDAPARQRTLRDTIAWSYDALSGSEQQVFRQISIFVGGFTLEAAEAVCGATLDDLGALVDASLLHRTEQTGRVTMLETVREYGLERLTESGEDLEIRSAHSRFYLALAEKAEPKLTSAAREPWLRQLERERGNLRAALRDLLERADSERALRLAGALSWFWFHRSHIAEGAQWLHEALELAGPAPTASRAKALAGAGLLAHEESDYGAAAAWCGEALTLFRELGDKRGTAVALSGLALVSRTGGDFRTARAIYEDAIALCKEADEPWLAAHLLERLGTAVTWAGDFERAKGYLEEALAGFRALRDDEGVAEVNRMAAIGLAEHDPSAALPLIEQALSSLRRSGASRHIGAALFTLAKIKVAQGDVVEARAAYEEILSMPGVLSDRLPVALSLGGLAWVAAASGDASLAVELLGAVERLFGVNGMVMPADERSRYERVLTTARAELDEPAFTASLERGKTLTLEEALAKALRAGAAEPSAGDLTTRELEILRLVAEGLSNGDVAARLVVSVRTVHAHLRSVYRKLGVSSRTAAARAAAEQALI